MTERGDVMQLRVRLGFGAGKDGERVVIVQATELNSALPTTIVVPLDLLAYPYVDQELLVQVPRSEAGSRQDCVAIPTHLRFMAADRFAPGRVGRLSDKTLGELDEKLRLVLDL